MTPLVLSGFVAGLHHAILVVGIGCAVYSVLINGSFLVLTGFAMADLLAYRRRLEFAGYDEWFLDPLTRGVSVLMPAYNESATIVQSVQAMTALRYPDFEVVVIDDGSKDDTVEKMIREFDMVEVPLVPGGHIETKGAVLGTWVSRRGSHNLALVAKTNGGKADALNAGINYSRKELVCMVDADSLLDPQALLDVSRPFADDPGRVVAAGGVVRVANGSRVERGRVTDLRMPRGWWARIQVVEYLRAFLIGRAGWSRAGGLLIISGAFGLFRKDVLLQVDGLSTDCIGEDAELVVRIHRLLGDARRDATVVFVPEPVAWTEVPEDRQVLRKQRRRWHRGLTEIMVRHKAMFLRPKYGVIGMLTMPWFLLFELLAPVVEVFGLLYFTVLMVGLGLEHTFFPSWNVVNLPIVVVLLTASILFAIFVTLVALLAEEMSFRRYRGLPDLFRAVRAAVEENFVYRQVNAWWRLGGIIEVIRKSRHDWGDMQRKGFGST
ncbi:cellulose synthase/poly-beta-1,6-N-acetylglucosamine synthase-like glycosyltransferase [Nocardioides ginsengisegetis]|uniref:Cellulose synthase/poly-beta-1,6-N-acetylglucosamine synthase-like glycosyltransferase n=1 Tax=Nocardioides ginsengisegetis TaxID=661491 RepID=A0A7W3IXR6_9ACTN|nr:glycosyltransferase family 2 protein [Nocardioides ginsengisegetis]MBA8802612.1 cellulose synthase/poly-beta-1,6-N-acetylglucosamine synthase-like glycosyltransferase [Nocardioides ginsengisegetis]